MSDAGMMNQQYGVKEAVSFETGMGGLTLAKLEHDAGEATVYLHGGHIVSWRPKGQDPVLWVSDESFFAPDQPIRGGVPICFPWFGPHQSDGSQPSHGFARLKQWEVKATGIDRDGATYITLCISDDAMTEAYWPQTFEATLTLKLSNVMTYSFHVKNTGEQGYAFEAALHTYFNVADVRQIMVEGLDGITYIDKTRAKERFTQNGTVTFIEETDRVYLNTQDPVIINDPWAGRHIIVEKRGSDATVVWNPWIDKAKAMGDFGDEEWKTMVCVETANVAENAVYLKAGDEHEMSVTLRVE